MPQAQKQQLHQRRELHHQQVWLERPQQEKRRAQQPLRCQVSSQLDLMMTPVSTMLAQRQTAAVKLLR
jgi:hypothetical protein